jgi:hypothetical protein
MSTIGGRPPQTELLAYDSRASFSNAGNAISTRDLSAGLSRSSRELNPIVR